MIVTVAIKRVLKLLQRGCFSFHSHPFEGSRLKLQQRLCKRQQDISPAVLLQDFCGVPITCVMCSNYMLLFSRQVVSNSLRPHGLKHARPPRPSLFPRAHSNSCPPSRWRHSTISSCVTPPPPALRLSQHQGLSQWVSSSHQVAKVLEFQIQHQSFQWILRTGIL